MSDTVFRRAVARRAALAAKSALPAVLGAAIAGCRAHDETDEARRAEAARIARAVETLREANVGEKALPLRALGAVPCAASDVCDVKAACVDAYSLAEHALEAVAAVRRSTASNPDPVSANAVALLERAERDLARSAELEKGCADREAALRRKYGVP